MIGGHLYTLILIILQLILSHCCQLNVLDVSTDVCTERQFNIPVVTTYGNKSYYFELNKKVNWYNAYLTCKQYNMELISIDSDAEFDYIREFINNVGPSDKVHVWTSGTDLGTEGEYLWMNNGRKIFSSRWHQGQPDNAGSAENCIHYWYTSNIYLLNDSRCENQMAFICQSIKKTCCNQQQICEC